MRIKGLFKLDLLALFAVSLAAVGHASIPDPQLEIPKNMGETLRGMPRPGPATFTSDDLASVFPLDMPPTRSYSYIGTRMVDHTINSFIHGSFFRESELGKVAQKVNNAFKTEIQLGETPVIVGQMAPKEVIAHKLDVQIEALQKRAFLKYRGFFDTNVNYTYLPEEDAIDIEWGRKIYRQTHMVFTYQVLTTATGIRFHWPWF